MNPISAAESSENINEDVPSIHLHFRTVQEEDAFLLFRALCRLSIKPIPERSDPKYAFFKKKDEIFILMGIIHDRLLSYSKIYF